MVLFYPIQYKCNIKVKLDIQNPQKPTRKNGDNKS